MVGKNRYLLTAAVTRFFHLAGTRKIKEEGVTFQSILMVSKHLFTPENVMDIQRIIGGDIIMAFDECPPGGSELYLCKKSWNLPIAGLTDVLTSFNTTP